MSKLQFEWDEDKEESNLQKHGVSFGEAMTIFYDEHAILIGDPDHSDDEDRFLLLGLSLRLRLLVVCHCYREDDQIIRIISARRANQMETNQYTRRYL